MIDCDKKGLNKLLLYGKFCVVFKNQRNKDWFGDGDVFRC